MQQRMPHGHGTQRFLRQLGVALGFWAAVTAQAAPPGLAKLPAAVQGAPGLAVAQSSVAPSVALSAPADGTLVVAPATLTLGATASDAHGSIVRVEFYQGTTLLGSATTAPYQVTWGPIPAGHYTLTAVATNDRRQSATSAPVGVLVNAPPTVSLVPPGALHLAPATLALTATASDADGSIARVEFLANGISLGTAASAPYAIDWRNVPAGTYSVIARATDDRGTSTDSPPVSVTVNSPPSVALTSPAADQVAAAPAQITLTASASDADGSVAMVEFYAGTTLVGTATAAPYSVSWSSVAAGAYTLTAKAIDNHGAVTTSAPVAILVDAPPSVALTSPAEATKVVAPSLVSMVAIADDSDGTVSKVDFYAGSSLVGTATAAPYSIAWNATVPGNYSLTAVATDDRGIATTSVARSLTVAPNQLPSISLTSPAANQVVVAPGNLTLTANASDVDGTVTRVDFYAGTTHLGTATSAPYGATWSNVPAGSYTLTAVASDDKGGVTTSAPVVWTVNAAPSVTLTGPAAGASFVAPARVTLTAAAADGDGSIAKVDFLANGALIGSATTAPYSVAWETVAVGSVSLTAVATDNRGATTASGAVAISLAANQAPVVSLTSPTAGQGFTAPATVTLTASASDVDGSIAQVAFYGNDTLLGTVTTAPYSLTWANLEAGSYTVTALATDDHGGVTTSAPLTLTVGAAPTRIVYLHADHLGTPRLATDSNGTVVWRHDPLTEPFGNAPPEEDPDGDGVPFRLNLRFPGQYFDAETNLAYNYYRDYDPQTGRYIQSDPIGLDGGINTYSYVGSNPVSYIDPLGLETCVLVTRMLGGFADHAALYVSRGSDSGGPAIYDPSGSYARSLDPHSGDLITGNAADVGKFADFYKKLDGTSTDKTCKDTSREEERRLFERALDLGGMSGPSCAKAVSTVLSGSPYYRSVTPGTVFPGNLFKDAKKP